MSDIAHVNLSRPFPLLSFLNSAGPVVEAHGRLFDAHCCTTLLKHRLDRTVEVVHRDQVPLEVWPVNSAFRFSFLACRSIAREHMYAAREAEQRAYFRQVKARIAWDGAVVN
jgi:hypothetical protein